MKLFNLERDVDESGVSGIGLVAEGCEFSDGRCIIAWIGLEKVGVHSIVVYDSLEDAKKVHGHRGLTRFVDIIPEES